MLNKLLFLLSLGLLLAAGLLACDSKPTLTPAAVSGPATATPKVAPTPLGTTPGETKIPVPVSPTPQSAAKVEEGVDQVTPELGRSAVPSTQGPDRPTAEPSAVTATPPGQTPTATPPPSATPSPTLARASDSQKPRDVSTAVTDEELATLVSGNSGFAFDLYRALVGSAGSSGDENLFFSPYSISLALAMAYAGASGETESQMAATLRFDLPQDKLHPAFNALDLELTSQSQSKDDDGFRLNVANSVWGQESHGFLPTFLDTLAENYGDQVRTVDFRRNAEDARLRINDWALEETEGRIKNLIPRDAVDRYTRLVLANAIYFKAAWSVPFKKGATAPRTFFHLDGSESEVPMMRQEAKLGYARLDGYQAVQLPYEDGRMSMTILLPDSGRFGEFENSLNGDTVEGFLERLETTLVRLTMPKFEIESGFSLPDTLETMGMPNAFNERAADFSGMDGLSCQAGDDECLLISDVLHKAFVSVDESGTEAVAATAVIVSQTKAVIVQPEPIEVTVDRPFVFFIRDQTTGATLFVGRILDP